MIKPITSTNVVRNSTAVTKYQRQVLCPQLIPVLDQIYGGYVYIASLFKEMFYMISTCSLKTYKYPIFLISTLNLFTDF